MCEGLGQAHVSVTLRNIGRTHPPHPQGDGSARLTEHPPPCRQPPLPAAASVSLGTLEPRALSPPEPTVACTAKNRLRLTFLPSVSRLLKWEVFIFMLILGLLILTLH